MKSFITVGIVLSSILCACTANQSGNQSNTETNSDSLTFDTTSNQVTKKTNCKDCPAFSIKIPLAKGPADIADSINTSLFNQVKNIYQVGENPFKATTLSALLDSFANAYEQDQKAAPDRVVGWEGTVKGSIVYESAELVNIVLDSYTMTGGAHGYQGKSSLIFDKKTGKKITVKELFKDENEVKKVAEGAFRKKFNIPSPEKLNNHGFMFENDVFILPQTFIFTQDGLQLYYNSYEIASYADGPKEVTIPYNQISELLTIH